MLIEARMLTTFFLSRRKLIMPSLLGVSHGTAGRSFRALSLSRLLSPGSPVRAASTGETEAAIFTGLRMDRRTIP